VLAALVGAVACTPAGASTLWRADHESGDLSSWYAGQTGSEYNSGRGFVELSRDIAHSGAWSAKLVMPTGQDGVRLFRYKESRTGRDLSYSVWYYIPIYYDIPSGWWNIFQFKSKSEDGERNDPFLSFNLRRRRGGGYSLYIFKKPERYSIRPRVDVKIPVARWFQIKAFLHQSATGDGRVIVWVDGTEMIRADGLTTKFPGRSQQNWSVDNYSAGVTPTPVAIYIDDARVEDARPVDATALPRRLPAAR
jgi:hypothetical protein